ncbi:MAG: hypothetical protein VX404_02850 [Planctomycetota bacterium]|nr:hypothetical protein [Planctomycetota bacterium]
MSTGSGMEALVLDVDIEDQLVLKTGGKLQLTALMQKRIVELKRGARPLVEIDSNDLQEIVIQEILQDKVVLAELEVTETSFLADARKLSGEGDSDEEKEVYGSDLKKVKEERIKELSQFLNPTNE